MAKSLASPFWLLLVWLVMGAMTLSGALCYGELAARFPQSGGPYVYLREIYGERAAFLFGWMSLLVLDPGLTAALATGLAAYAAYIAPMSAAACKLTAIAVIVALCLLNARSTRFSARVLRLLTWFKFIVLASLVVWALVFRLGSWSHFVPFVAQRPGALPLLPALAAAMVGAFFSFGGWWSVCNIAGEVREPEKNMPRAMVIGVLAVTAAYVLVSAVFLYLVPLSQVTSDETFVAQAGQKLLGPSGGAVFAAIVILCVLGSLAAQIMLAPRVYFAMAEDGLFLHSVARPHPRFGTPSRAIFVECIIAAILVMLGSFEQIIAYFIFVVLIFLGLCAAGLYFLRRRRDASDPSFLTPGYPFTPCVFLALIALMLFLMATHSPRESALGCAVVLAGLPVYHFFRRARP